MRRSHAGQHRICDLKERRYHRLNHPIRPAHSYRRPDLAAAAAAFREFCARIAQLRDPVSGCPWDLEQTHQSLRRYMLEEAYEAAEVMGGGSAAELSGELGDVLLQVVLNSQVALDAKQFSIVDVVRSIDAKMRRRHPHVFAPSAAAPAVTSSQVHATWDEIKRQEKAAAPPTASGYFAGLDVKHPASAQAYKIGKLAAKIHFDWDSPLEVLAQVQSEVDELAAELRASPVDREKAAEELGDVYFSLAQLSRHLHLDPEVVALDANRKFLGRFAKLESLAAAQGIDIATASRETLEGLWRQAKVKHV